LGQRHRRGRAMDSGGRRLERVFSQDARVDQIAHKANTGRCEGGSATGVTQSNAPRSGVPCQTPKRQ